MKIVKIGRDRSNDVNINDSLVSRSHCQIIQDDRGEFRLIDTNSRNGTYINGTKRHGEVLLKKTDIVRIGNTTLPWQTYFTISGETGYNGDRTEFGGGYRQSYDNIINISNSNDQVCTPSVSTPPTPNIPKPSNYLVWAILSTMFCCLPFGIPSIVYASKVDGLWYAGRYEEAQEAASKARLWFWLSFGFGFISFIIYIIYCIIVGAAIGGF